VHIGRAQGQPIKITASSRMTLAAVLEEGARDKGLQMVGVVDCGSPLVLQDIHELLDQGRLNLTKNGDLITPQGVMLVLGVEVESGEGAHFIIYLPHLQAVEKCQQIMARRVKNPNLSTQKSSFKAQELLNLAAGIGGLFVVAHAFTPHRGAYGFWVSRLADGLGPVYKQVNALELGLSADTDMAGIIGETRQFPFLSNSDAHSLATMGREYNLLRMAGLGFAELRMALAGEGGRRIVANYGMHPLLGKYHRSFCPQCRTLAREPEPLFICPQCGHSMIPGVWDRVWSIRDYEEPHHPVGRPPYHYRVPLSFLPGLGPKTYTKLRCSLGSEIEIMERSDLGMIERVAGPRVAGYIERMRSGRLEIVPGGGGYYGRVKKSHGDD